MDLNLKGNKSKKMETKHQFIRINDKWYNWNNAKGKEWDEIKKFTEKEASLLRLEEKTQKEIMKKMKITKIPDIIVVDGVDGVGKSTVVGNIIKEFEKEGLKVRFNTFKRRRSDDKRFEEPTVKYEWLFRKQVVEQINRRMIEWDNDVDIVILDKSPYCEFFYQRVSSFDRGWISPYGNYKMESEILKYKDIIDNAIVVFLKNEKSWENYIGRESKKNGEGHKSSYETLKKEEYMEMVDAFENYQFMYEDTRRYDGIEIANDNKSWEKVYKSIKEFLGGEHKNDS